MIKFKQDTTLTVVSGFDEETDNITEESEDTFKKGEAVDADIVDDDGPFVDLQFGDGSVCYGVQRESFEVIEVMDE